MKKQMTLFLGILMSATVSAEDTPSTNELPHVYHQCSMAFDSESSKYSCQAGAISYLGYKWIEGVSSPMQYASEICRGFYVVRIDL